MDELSRLERSLILVVVVAMALAIAQADIRALSFTMGIGASVVTGFVCAAISSDDVARQLLYAPGFALAVLGAYLGVRAYLDRVAQPEVLALFVTGFASVLPGILLILVARAYLNKRNPPSRDDETPPDGPLTGWPGDAPRT